MGDDEARNGEVFMTDKEIVDYVAELLNYHLIVWIDRDGNYQLKATKKELYKAIYDLRTIINKEREK